jgi:hypothetical protein
MGVDNTDWGVMNKSISSQQTTPTPSSQSGSQDLQATSAPLIHDSDQSAASQHLQRTYDLWLLFDSLYKEYNWQVNG